MANYNYDEAGNMATYFLLTLLCIILIPLTLTTLAPLRKPQVTVGCQCRACSEQRENIRRREKSFISSRTWRKTLFLAAGWVLVAFLAHKVANTEVENKVYDPFEILGLRSGVDLKTIKSHYKKLSRKFHPDKVKLGINETMEAIETKFVEITKAYKSLTDENIRKNWELYGHPDGRQEVSMGIALPKWIVESGNNVWVLGAYGLIFGGALPALVGSWWFGNREKTKDGVNARSAATFFRDISDESGLDDVVGSLGKAFEWERPQVMAKREDEVDEVDQQIKERFSGKWNELSKLADAMQGEHETRRRALILLYAHLLRIPIGSPTLRKEQVEILLQTPVMLNSMLTVNVSRMWLQPILATMRLHAYIAQAIPPGQDSIKLAQFPGVSPNEAVSLLVSETADKDAVTALIETLEQKGDGRVSDIKKVAERWGRAELVDAALRVVGERHITPQAHISLVLKLRITPPGSERASAPTEVDSQSEARREQEFLNGKKEVEDLAEEPTTGWAHAPHWPAHRKPGWWAVLADMRASKLMTPPIRISEVPMGPQYRMFKQTFQGPPQVGPYHWRLYLVSDTFVGEEVVKDLTWKVEDPAVVNVMEMEADDEISEPEEDSLAGQMALMRGGSVKRHGDDDESDGESTTDDDRKGDSDGSSSDSD